MLHIQPDPSLADLSACNPLDKSDRVQLNVSRLIYGRFGTIGLHAGLCTVHAEKKNAPGQSSKTVNADMKTSH